jgi:hypothetical protein
MYFLLTGQEPLALTVSSPKDGRPDVSEAADLIVQRATQQDVFLRYQSAAEMKEELDYVLDGDQRPVPQFKWLELTVGVMVMVASVIGWFGYSKYVEVQKNATQELNENIKTQHDLKKQLDEVRLREASLQKLVAANISRDIRDGKNAHSIGFAAPEGGESNNTAGGGMPFSNFMSGFGKPKNENGQNSSDQVGSLNEAGELGPPVAMTYPTYSETGTITGKPAKGGKFKDQALVDHDESQLTDPDGLAPLEEDTQR